MTTPSSFFSEIIPVQEEVGQTSLEFLTFFFPPLAPLLLSGLRLLQEISLDSFHDFWRYSNLFGYLLHAILMVYLLPSLRNCLCPLWFSSIISPPRFLRQCPPTLSKIILSLEFFLRRGGRRTLPTFFFTMLLSTCGSPVPTRNFLPRKRRLEPAGVGQIFAFF